METKPNVPEKDVFKFIVTRIFFIMRESLPWIKFMGYAHLICGAIGILLALFLFWKRGILLGIPDVISTCLTIFQGKILLGIADSITTAEATHRYYHLVSALRQAKLYVILMGGLALVGVITLGLLLFAVGGMWFLHFSP